MALLQDLQHARAQLADPRFRPEWQRDREPADPDESGVPVECEDFRGTLWLSHAYGGHQRNTTDARDDAADASLPRSLAELVRRRESGDAGTAIHLHRGQRKSGR